MAKADAKPNLGDKQVCPECEKKFYDLTKRPAVCPYCGTSFDPSAIAVPIVAKPKPDRTAKKDNGDDDEEDIVDVDEDEVDEEDIDQDEAAAKELELDGDASFGGTGSDDGDDNGDTLNMDGFSTDDDEDVVADDDDDEQDVLPPTGADGDDEDDNEDEEDLTDLDDDDEDALV